ncbi:MAG: hypothetical protein IPJ00_02100 [Saprospirales bacterium]|nr:hypothetical protein [Saprospirales bacterium]
MHQKLGEQPFALDQTATAPGEYAFQVTRMQYYISEIKLIHDGGQVTPVTDLYLLVSAEKDDQFDLGSFALENIEGIEFSIGVDEAHNHLDPALYSTHHPLALHNPPCIGVGRRATGLSPWKANRATTAARAS